MAEPHDAGTTSPSAIRRRNLGDDVYRVLWARILSRELHPGDKLSDLRLSAELGVSRTPIREALHRLLQDGVIRAQPNRGFFVNSFSARDIEDIYEIRSALEALALRTVVIRHPDENYSWALEQLDDIAQMIASAESDDEVVQANERFLEADQGFHQFLVDRAGNERLTTLINGIWAQIAVFQKVGTHVPGYVEIALRQHREIITLLHEQQHADAIEALEAHIRDMKTRVIADIAASSDDTAES